MKKSILKTLLLAVCWVGAYSQAQAVEKLKLDKPLKVGKVEKVRTVIDPHKRERLSDERPDRTSAFLWTVPTDPPITFTGAKAPPKLGARKTRVADLSAPSSNSIIQTLNNQHNILWEQTLHDEWETLNPQMRPSNPEDPY